MFKKALLISSTIVMYAFAADPIDSINNAKESWKQDHVIVHNRIWAVRYWGQSSSSLISYTVPLSDKTTIADVRNFLFTQHKWDTRQLPCVAIPHLWCKSRDLHKNPEWCEPPQHDTANVRNLLKTRDAQDIAFIHDERPQSHQ